MKKCRCPGEPEGNSDNIAYYWLGNKSNHCLGACLACKAGDKPSEILVQVNVEPRPVMHRPLELLFFFKKGMVSNLVAVG